MWGVTRNLKLHRRIQIQLGNGHFDLLCEQGPRAKLKPLAVAAEVLTRGDQLRVGIMNLLARVEEIGR